MFKGLAFFIKFGWKHEKRYLVYRVLSQLISSLIPIIAVVMPRYIIDELMGGGRIPQLLFYAGILIGYTFLASLSSNWLQWKGFTLRIKLAQDFSVILHQKTVGAGYADIESSSYIEMKERAEKFLFGNWRGFSYVLDMAIEIIGKGITLAGIVFIIASLNPLLVLFFSAFVLLSSYVEMRSQRQRAKLKVKLTAVERQTVYYSRIMEDFSYGKEIRINGLGDWLIKRENQHWGKGYELYKKHNAMGIRSGAFHSLTNLVQHAASYGYLLLMLLGGHISIGDFSMYAGGAAAFTGAMRSLMQNIIEVGEFRTYYSAIDEYLNIPANMRENKKLPLPGGSHKIEFKNVSFAYPGQAGYALRNINITLEPGRRLAIVGENGAGKTTFVKLLCRIYDPTEGAVLLDGVDIRDIDYDQYTSLFSTVFQDFKLYALSLKDNVALSKSDAAGDFEVENALCKAGFSEKLKELPKGVHTLVYRNFDGEGFEPSGGEGQKIALARALFKDAPIVILDEPTSALDPRAEHDIYLRFSEMVEGKTAVYISHRLASARFCDSIAVFEGGRITERGSHDELISQGKAYSQMFSVQAKYYDWRHCALRGDGAKKLQKILKALNIGD